MSHDHNHETSRPGLNVIAAGNAHRINALQPRVAAIVERIGELTDAQLTRLGEILVLAAEAVDVEAVARTVAHLDAKFDGAA